MMNEGHANFGSATLPHYNYEMHRGNYHSVPRKKPDVIRHCMSKASRQTASTMDGRQLSEG
jgi:hypothetical protein